MSTLLSVSTGSGKLTITEQSVVLDIPGGRKSEQMARTLITSVDAHKLMPSLFGMGGGSDITIHTSDGRKLTLRFVKPKDADAILRLLR